MGKQYVSTGHDVLVTTTFDVPGFQIVQYMGIVRGITVRSRGIGGQFVAGLQQMVGGQIGAYVEMCEHAREEAMQFMLTHARERGANAVIGMRYDATELGQGVSEVLAYGTAVLVQPYQAAGYGQPQPNPYR
jgi:uncharacterized protein YbjQ (UPF0145 family)